VLEAVFRRLSVFAGVWTLDMAEDVCSGAGIEHSDVLEVLAQLVDKHQRGMSSPLAPCAQRALLQKQHHYEPGGGQERGYNEYRR